MTKVSLFALAVSTTIGAMASAQPAAPIAAPVPVATPCPCPKAFQGFYLGGNVGYGIGGAQIRNVGADVIGFDHRLGLDVKGFDGGLNVGYTHRFDNVGLGIEGVFNWTSTKGTQNLAATAAGFVDFKQRARLNNSIQLRGNISYIICNLVAPKVILGWDNSQWTNDISLDVGNFADIPQLTVTNKKRYNGFLWGAGVDFLLAKHIIAGIEYTGVLSDRKSFSVAAAGLTADTTSFRPQYNKFALTVKFIY